jgi:hypothetical protein
MSADLSLLQYDIVTGFELRLSRDYCSGSYAAGVQKLAQQFIAELMTLAGSVRFDPNYGCSFMNDIRSRNATAIGDIQRALSMNIARVVANRRSREIGNEPQDELLRNVEIAELNQKADKVVASLRVRSEAGESAVVQLPLSLLEG